MEKMMKRILCICGLVCCLLAPQAVLAADRTLTDGDGNSLVLRESSQAGYFTYSSENAPFTFDIPALFTKAESIDDPMFVLLDETDTCRFDAASFRPVGPLTVKEFFEANRENLGVKPAYEKLGKDFFVLSWAHDDAIYYQRVLFIEDSVCVLEISYPAERKKEFDPLVTHCANSLKYSIED